MIALVSLYTALSLVQGASAAEQPCIFMDPSLSVAQTGEYFSLNVSVSNAILLWAYQIYISFSPEVLEVTGVVEGNFLIRSLYNNTFWLAKWNNTEGLIQVWESLRANPPEPPPPVASGTGELFQITFKAKNLGSCILHLHDTAMVFDPKSYIPHTTLDGVFSNLPNELTQEITWASSTFYVKVSSDSTVSAVAFDQPQRTLYFNVTGSEGTDGHAVVSIPPELLRAQTGEWQVIIDTTPTTPFVLTNSTYTFFYLNYTHSTRQIRITGTEAIPEFTPAPILLMVTFMAIAFMTFMRKRTRQAQD
jgi:hypothetical protein